MKPPPRGPADPADYAATRRAAARRAWAKALVADADRAGDRPVYGSPEWLALPDRDRRKLAAAIVAAECWATDLDELPQRLAAELDALHAAEDAWWADRHADLVRTVHSNASRAAYTLRRHYAKTEAQRVAEARQPRPSDRYPCTPERPRRTRTSDRGTGDAA